MESCANQSNTCNELMCSIKTKRVNSRTHRKPRRSLTGIVLGQMTNGRTLRRISIASTLFPTWCSRLGSTYFTIRKSTFIAYHLRPDLGPFPPPKGTFVFVFFAESGKFLFWTCPIEKKTPAFGPVGILGFVSPVSTSALVLFGEL